MPTTISTKKPLRYKSPRYPTRLDVASDPTLLAEHIPSTWLGRSELAGALGVLLAVNTAQALAEATKPAAASRPAATTQPAATAPANDMQTAIVAPLFEHGEGRGTAGCIAANPPAFVSEEEALQIIREELGHAGAKFTKTNVPVEAIALPVWLVTRKPVEDAPATQPGLRVEWEYKPFSEKTVPFVADLASEDGAVLIEYVSGTDFLKLNYNLATGYEVDTKHCAEQIREAVSKSQSSAKLAVFYDPLVPVGPFEILPSRPASSQPRHGEKAHAEAKRLLRLQVQDFVKWLKAQGAM